MVLSWVADCRLLAIWIHTGYRVTYYLVTGSRLIALPISRNPMRCLVFVSRPHTWEPELSELQLCVFWGHVAGGVCLVACSWRPGCLRPGTPLPTCCILLVIWSQTGHPLTDYLVTLHWLCEQFHTAANASRTVHHQMSE